MAQHHPLSLAKLPGSHTYKRWGDETVCVAETVALASSGQVFAPDGNGTVWQAASLNAPLEEWAHVGGRPLGAMVDSTGDLLIADAARVCHPSFWLY